MTPLVKRVLQSRRNLCQLIIVAVLLALGVNLISSWIAHEFSTKPWVIWVVGLLLVVIAGLYLVRFLIKESSVSQKFEAAIILDPKTKNHVEIEQYGFSKKFNNSLRAIIVENKALKTSWESERVFARDEKLNTAVEEGEETTARNKSTDEAVSYFAIVQQEVEIEEDACSQKSILIEIAEFCMLEFLSLHLSAYFGHTPHDENKIVTIEREHIPALLLDNRVLSLLSTPIEDRQIFVQSGINKHPPDGVIHSIYASNGAVYERFNLILPKGTSITRPHPGVINLEHRHFILTITCRFSCFSLNLPRYFEALYIGSESKKLDSRQLDISISAQLKSSSFTLLSSWVYYQWIDSFMEYLKEEVSFDSFLDRIDWQSTSTRIRASMILDHRKKEMKSKQQDETSPKEPPSEEVEDQASA